MSKDPCLSNVFFFDLISLGTVSVELNNYFQTHCCVAWPQTVTMPRPAAERNPGTPNIRQLVPDQFGM